MPSRYRASRAPRPRRSIGGASLKRVEELGGTVIMPLTEVAPETKVGLFADPEGHVVGLM